jgi:hypothetical protein
MTTHGIRVDNDFCVHVSIDVAVNIPEKDIDPIGWSGKDPYIRVVVSTDIRMSDIVDQCMVSTWQYLGCRHVGKECHVSSSWMAVCKVRYIDK